jgi:gas vesicle protein
MGIIMSDDKQSPSSSESGRTAGFVPPETEQKVREDLRTAAERARQTAEDLKQQAQEQVGEATQKAKTFATEQKDFAANQLDGIANTVSKVADEMEGGDQAVVARYAHEVANGIHRFADNVKQRDLTDVIGMAEDFGRRQPIAFLGAAALAGFVASRLITSSSQRRTQRDGDGGQPGSYGTANQYGSAGYGSAGEYGSGAGSQYGSSAGSRYGSPSQSGSSYSPGTSSPAGETFVETVIVEKDEPPLGTSTWDDEGGTSPDPRRGGTH